MERYAVYYAPPAGHALAVFAAAWLGRCPEGHPVGHGPAVPGLAPDKLATILAEPARYGFHGTLKPPFRLAAGRSEAELHATLDDLARGLRPFELPPLRLAAIGRFLALVPDGPSPALDAVTAACVLGLDPFRAPPGAAELARRRRAPLDARHEALLQRWGYPYVLDRFRFHLTLTGSVAPDEQAALLAALAPLLAPFTATPLAFADLALFVEPTAGAPFRLERRFPLGATRAS